MPYFSLTTGMYAGASCFGGINDTSKTAVTYNRYSGKKQKWVYRSTNSEKVLRENGIYDVGGT